MTDSPYRVPLEQLEQERVLRTEQVVLVGDGAVPPTGLWGPVGDGGPGDGGADGD